MDSPIQTRIQQLQLYQFKNYHDKIFDFEHNIVAMAGANGTGKTTLLDAIYYLCYTKSYLHSTDQQVIKFGQQQMRVEGTFYHTKVIHIKSIIRDNNKKSFFVNQEEITRLSDFIGSINSIFISPDDVALINDGGETRRKFINSYISQIDKNYFTTLQKYNRVLLHRNALLKQGITSSNHELLQTIDEQLVQHGTQLFEMRNQYLPDLLQTAKQLYAYFSNQSEPIDITHSSLLHQFSFEEILKQNISKDIALQRTSQGVHKDDLVILLHAMPFKHAASQGQRKSLLFAMKLAQFELIKTHTKQIPILLLDDLFEKLDAERMNRLIYFVKEANAQLFVTDTHVSRIKQVFGQRPSDFQLINL
jgi:recF protein